MNVKGSWLWARELVPVFKAQGHGQLLFVSSVAGLRTFARCSAYGASKWAVQGIAGSIREECKGSGVKVATLCPGSVATPWWLEQARGGKPEPASAEQLAKMLSPDDVAAAALAIVEQVPTAARAPRARLAARNGGCPAAVAERPRGSTPWGAWHAARGTRRAVRGARSGA